MKFKFENFHSIVGYVLNNNKFPGFAKSYFVDCEGNYYFQSIKGEKIERIKTSFETLKKLEGNHDINGVSYTEKGFFENPVYAFAFSEYDYCIGSKKEVANFLEFSYKKHKKQFKNPFLSQEIVEFVAKTKKEEMEVIK